jgi:hypothetical protein
MPGVGMRRSSSPALTAVALVAGLAVLALAGRLLPGMTGTRPTTTAAGTTVRIVAPTIAQARQTRVPNAVGQALAEAAAVLRDAGLRGVPAEGDPRQPDAVVIAQEPPAGELIDAGRVVGLRTTVDLVPNGTAHRMLLRPDPTVAVYLVEAPDPARHRLTVAATMPRTADLAVHIEPGAGQPPLIVLSVEEDADGCRPSGDQVRCVVRFDALEALPAGRWIVALAKAGSGAPRPAAGRADQPAPRTPSTVN